VLLYGEPGDANDTQDIEAFWLLLRLCERVLLRPARLVEEPIRCKPLSSRCLPLSFNGRSIMMASLGGVPGGDGDIPRAWSTTTESIDKGSIAEDIISYAASAGKRFSAGKGPEAMECTVSYKSWYVANKKVRPEAWGPST
jgi:hypothetical protein